MHNRSNPTGIAVYIQLFKSSSQPQPPNAPDLLILDSSIPYPSLTTANHLSHPANTTNSYNHSICIIVCHLAWHQISVCQGTKYKQHSHQKRKIATCLTTSPSYPFPSASAYLTFHNSNIPNTLPPIQYPNHTIHPNRTTASSCSQNARNHPHHKRIDNTNSNETNNTCIKAGWHNAGVLTWTV
jgi:hypothetical protein